MVLIQMDEIQKLLEAISETASVNKLTLENVQGWLVEYLEMRAEDVARFPNEANADHWDMIAADYDSSKEAQFIAAYFSAGRVTFIAGRGSIPEVQAFAQDGFPDNPDRVLAELERRFTTGERWETSADEVTAWVQG